MFHFYKGATDLLKDLKTEEKVKEEEYQQVAEGSEGYIEIRTNGGKRTRCLLLELDSRNVLTEVLSERETKTTVNPSVRMQPGGYNNTELITRLVSSSVGENLRVNLPKLQLPVFDGNLQQWQEFWDIYKATIHEQHTMPAVWKFNYLNRAC